MGRHFAILGAGNIARTMAATVQQMPGITLYAVASRSMTKSMEFAREFQIPHAYGSYQELVEDPNVDLVYIATPHSHHAEHAMLCLSHHKPVLCEKAFTATAHQAKAVLDMARKEQVFISEAIWTRFMPFIQTIRQEIAAGAIGDVKLLTANLGYPISHVPRLIDPHLAGGALLDLSVYPIHFASMIMGDSISAFHSSCEKLPSGVDAQDSITLQYPNGSLAILYSTIYTQTDRKGILYGTKGSMEIENINNFESYTLFDASHTPIKTVQRPPQITGYEYEVEAAFQALEEGNLMCPQAPHKVTLDIMSLLDALRHEWGIYFPFESDL